VIAALRRQTKFTKSIIFTFMKFKASAELTYTAASNGTIILNIEALGSPHQVIIEEAFTLEPAAPFDQMVLQPTDTRLVRFEMSKGQSVKVSYTALVDNAVKITEYHTSKDVPSSRLPAEILTYLYPSRYCQSDRLSRMADNLFGKIGNAFDKVMAVTEWIYQNIKYLTGSSSALISAHDTVISQTGVCKDFAHLGIAFCRALDVPARYFTGYAYKLVPQDFHACFEAYLGGEWVLFDPTRLAPLNGMVKIANGRDASDSSVANIFGEITLKSMKVNCELAGEDFAPIYHFPNRYHGVSYL
jgi:transglutaminase-like putative cysteine protease